MMKKSSLTIYNYSKGINQVNPRDSSILLTILFDCREEFDNIEKWISYCQDHFDSPISSESLKKECKTELKSYIKTRIVNNPKLSWADRLSNSLNKDNLIISLLRMYEWPYWSDSQMNYINKTIPKLIERGEINLFNYQDCPYKEELSHDFLEDVELNWEHICEYWKNNNLINVDKAKFYNSIKVLVSMIEGKTKVPDHLKSYINSIKEVRYRQLDMSMLKNLYEINKPKYIMKKDTGTTWNQEVPLLKTIQSNFGLKSINSLVGNYFYGNTNILSHNKFKEELISVDYNMDWLFLSAGKGDCYKTRYVGAPAPVFQNILAPLSLGLEDIQRKNPNIATFDQLSRYQELIRNSDDVFGIDFSGYSDYLSRNSIKWFLKNIYKWNDEVVRIIMEILNLPIKSGGKLYYYRYGTLQGIKFDFPIITELNQFMWAISNIYCGMPEDYSVFVGDDRSQHSLNGKFPDHYMDVCLSITSLFNCITNHEKTESWKDSNFSSFCKVSYDNQRNPISGISGNLSLKQKVFCTDISATINQMIKVGITTKEEVFENKIIDNLIYCFKDKIDLYARLLNEDYTSPINTAKLIPLEWGGLGEDHSLETVQRYISQLKSFIFNYTNSPNKPIDKTLVALYKMGLSKHKYTKEIFDLKYGKKEIDKFFESVDRINSLKFYDLELIRETRKLASLIMQEISEKSGKKSISTKNRTDIRFDSDILMRPVIENIENYSLSAQGLEENAILLSLKNSGNPTNLKLYIKYKELQSKLKDQGDIVHYFSATTQYEGVKCGNRILRLEGDSNSYYRQDKFIRLDEVRDKDKLNYYHLYRKLRHFARNEISVYLEIFEEKLSNHQAEVVNKMIKEMEEEERNNLVREVKREMKEELRSQLRSDWIRDEKESLLSNAFGSLES